MESKDEDAAAERRALAVPASEHAIFGLDADGNVASWNSNAERMKGYSAEEIIGRHFSVFYPAEQVVSGYPDWELRRAADVGFYVDEGWRVRKDGSRFWAHVVITAQRALDGSVSGFIKVTRDESAPHDRLLRSNQRFTDLFALSPVGIGVFDDAGRLLDANEALGEVLGYRMTDLYSLDAADLLDPHDGEEWLFPRTTGPADTGRQVVPQRMLVRADGARVYCDLHITTSVANDGRRFWLVAFQDVTERHRHAQQLLYEATHDVVTGLPNRRAVLDLLAELLRDNTKRVAVLFCDIDNFKRINDSLGHDVGDELLATLARRLEDGLPSGCTPARQAGDEFVIVCPDVDEVGGVQALAAKVADLLRTTVPARGQLVQISASVGAAVLGDSVARGEDLVRFADAAMFEAKLRGPGRISLADEALMISTDRKIQLEGQLREALAADGLVLHYQPVVARDGAVVAAEALVRWPHPVHGLLAPDVLLPVAKQGGLTRDLDRWVLRTALREAASWHDFQGRPVDVAINLGDLTPGGPDFVDEVSEIINDSGIDWHRVVLELVETTLIDLPSRPQKAMRQLVARGVRFAVDDFGTGYSSLARLKDLPVQIIKIDRQFVSGLGTHASDSAVVRAVADMASAMGRSCIAEGVETADQFRMLSNLGVNTYQGWLFSRAVPPSALREILDQSLRSIAVPG